MYTKKTEVVQNNEQENYRQDWMRLRPTQKVHVYNVRGLNLVVVNPRTVQAIKLP
jgi:hypothetical protein